MQIWQQIDNQMKYSFIIPTYNSLRWIQPCIESILAQTFTGFDIIILDSGSTDDTLGWIRSLNNTKIRIYPADSRLGIVENWQRITSVPRHEFMTIMGHDDIIYPNYLATINSLIESNPGAALYQTHFDLIDENGKIIRACLPMKTHITPELLLESVLQHTIEIVATGFMVRSKTYDSVGGISPYPNLLYADTELWLKLILNSYLAVAQETCFGFRFHIKNTSKSPGKIRLIAFERMVDFFGALQNEDPKYKSVIEENAGSFLKNYAIGSCHKLIYFPEAGRDDVNMDDIIASAKRCAQKIMPSADFEPEKFPAIRLAKLIDSNRLLRSLFLFYKSFQKRTY